MGLLKGLSPHYFFVLVGRGGRGRMGGRDILERQDRGG